MALKILDAVQKHHPDNPSSGWTVTVLDSKGLLYARFYGATKKAAEKRAARFKRALTEPLYGVGVPGEATMRDWADPEV